MTAMKNKWLAGVAFLLVCFVADAARPTSAQITPRLGVALIHGYQHWLHPVSSHFVRCNLEPTCSRFAIDALEEQGLRGALAIGPRLLQCERAGHANHATLVSNAVRPMGLMLLSGDVAGCFGCMAFSGFFVVLIVALVATWIMLLVWVARDAKNRGVENPVLWMLLVFFLHTIGLILYLLTRPGGNLIPCPSCGNKKLQYANVCPHCGNAAPGGPAAAALPATAFCPGCGTPLKPGARFCEKCGTAAP